MTQQQVFSPKQVARAIGASESSVKRWCDRGLLPSIKTVGGHRRLPIAGILNFVRSEGAKLVRPEELGLPAHAGDGRFSTSKALPHFREALLQANAAVCGSVIFDLYLAKRSIAAICDEVIAPAMHGIGDAWECGEADVFEERCACEIVSSVLHDLLGVLPKPSSNAPLAMGGTLAGDPYGLATRMVELTLRDCGWKTVSLGCGIPLSSLQRAVASHQPALFWLSVSAIENEALFLEEFQVFSDVCAPQTALVVGGRALNEHVRKRMKYAAYCDNLQHLETFVRSTFQRKQQSQ